MNQKREASNLPQDVIHRAHQEERRGVSPEVLVDIGEFVPEISELRPEDYARAMGEDPDTDSTGHLEDPELDAEWRRGRVRNRGSSVPTTDSGSEPTSVEKNATARRAEIAHKIRARQWRQTNRW